MKIKSLILIISLLSVVIISQSQDTNYYPKGNPDLWTVEITPFLILPNVIGEVQSEYLSEEFGIGPADFINTLNGTIMLDAEISRGKFFLSPAYIYNYNDVEKILWTSGDGSQTIVMNPSLQKHILEVLTGLRFNLADEIILDPFVGFRYTNYHVFGDVEGIVNMTEIDEHAGFWDPVIGFHLHCYPLPRIPIELKTDIGGFGAGSELTWSLMFDSGYALSPSIDILAGFALLSNRYESETTSGRSYGMTSVTYGFDFGARFYIPGRGKDPSVFKKIN